MVNENSENSEEYKEESVAQQSQAWVSDEELENLRFAAKYNSILENYPQIKDIEIRRNKRRLGIKIHIITDPSVCDIQFNDIPLSGRKYTTYEAVRQAITEITPDMLVGSFPINKEDVWNACNDAMHRENEKYHISDRLNSVVSNKSSLQHLCNVVKMDMPDLSFFGCLGHLKRIEQYSNEERQFTIRHNKIAVSKNIMKYSDSIKYLTIEIDVNGRRMWFRYDTEKKNAEAVNVPDENMIAVIESALENQDKFREFNKKIVEFKQSHDWAGYMNVNIKYFGGTTVQTQIEGINYTGIYAIPLESGDAQETLLGLAFKDVSKRTEKILKEEQKRLRQGIQENSEEEREQIQD